MSALYCCYVFQPSAPTQCIPENQVLNVFQERRIISDETARFEELLVRQRDFFVEEELKEKYKRLVSFVQQTEAAMSSGKAGGLVLEIVSWEESIRRQAVITFLIPRTLTPVYMCVKAPFFGVSSLT